MALTRRHFAALLAGGSLAGCSALTNDDIELAIENRSSADQRIVAHVYPPGDDPGEPVYEGTLPTGSRKIVPDVTEAPLDGRKDVTVRVESDSDDVTRTVTITGPGTISAMHTRAGIDIEFGRRD